MRFVNGITDSRAGKAYGLLSGPVARVRAVWSKWVSGSRVLEKVITGLNSSRLVGEGGIFHGGDIPGSHMVYFELPVDGCLTYSKTENKKSAED